MFSCLKYLKNISAILIVCYFLLLPGCYKIGWRNVLYTESIKTLKAKRGIYDMQFLCSRDALVEVIKWVGVRISDNYRAYFAKENDGGINELLEKNRLLFKGDILIVGSAYRDYSITWEHVFIIRAINSNRCGLFLLRPAYAFGKYASMEDYPESVYFFDWESAIAEECARRGITVLVE